MQLMKYNPVLRVWSTENHAKCRIFCSAGVKGSFPFFILHNFQYNSPNTDEDFNMSNTTNINYSDTEGKGNLTLYENHFDKGGKYYARFDRKNVTIDNLIARTQKKDIGVNAITAKHILSLIKAEIIEALQRGESVNLMDLGIFYIAATGTTGNTAETAEIKKLLVKFTSSKETNEAISKIEINKVIVADATPSIDSVTNLFTGKKDGTVTYGKAARIDGSRLKVSGDDGGIFFAECEADGSFSEDESTWHKVNPDNIMRNLLKTLEFFLPEELEAGKNYRIIIRTNCRKGSENKKTFVSAVSEIVSVK